MKDAMVIAYVPVLHEGYRQFFLAHRDEYPDLRLIHPDHVDMKSVKKNVPALPPESVAQSIKAWSIFESVEVASPDELITFPPIKVLTYVDDVNQFFLNLYLPMTPVSYDSRFLRWDRTKSIATRPVSVDLVADPSSIDQVLMLQSIKLGEKSGDWWRQVGAMVVKDGKVIASILNKHTPDEEQPYFYGDPRAEFSQGVHLELSTAEHCEAYLVGQAACEGVALKGTDLYVSTFPCPPCARLLSRTKIKRLLYHDGYAMLDGEEVLRNEGIEIIQVKF